MIPTLTPGQLVVSDRRRSRLSLWSDVFDNDCRHSNVNHSELILVLSTGHSVGAVCFAFVMISGMVGYANVEWLVNA